MRTVYLGTSGFAAAVLERLAATAHRPGLVVTRPDRPRGRGRRVASPPVAEAARRLGLDVIAPEQVNAPEAIDRIADAAPDAVCVCAYGALLREPLLSRWPTLNVHPSLLPRWRGAAPIERAIMAGDSSTGVSIMRPIAELDAGPVCLAAEEPIGPRDTYGSLAERLQALSGELLVRALDVSPPLVEQDPAAATYAEKIERADRELDPARPAAELERRVRALEPHIGARLTLRSGELLRVHEAGIIAAEEGAPPAGRLQAVDGRLRLGCASGALELLIVHPAGGRAMSGAEYLRGHGVPD